jgi:protocatechuate 3,4-dioxygenase beta subunit
MLRHIKDLCGPFIVPVVVCLILGNSAFGQTATSSLRGIVTDPSGAPVPNAKVTISNPATGVATSKTDKDGAYQFSS